jgi:hypothetical protein
MRIASGDTSRKVPFVAVLSSDHVTRATGLSSFTVYRSRDGGTATLMTTPTIAEADATNMKGLYWLTCDEDMTIGAGNDEEAMVFHVTAATMDDVTVAIELFRPKITEGNTLGVAADGDVSGNVDGSVASVVGHTAQTGDTYALANGSAGFVAIDTVVDAIKAVTDNLPDSGALTSIAQAAALATVDTNVDAILVDTGTTIPAQISALNDLSFADIWTAALTESYNTDGSAFTPAQALFLITQFLYERETSGTTVTVKKLDGSTTAATLTLNDGTAPTSKT